MRRGRHRSAARAVGVEFCGTIGCFQRYGADSGFVSSLPLTRPTTMKSSRRHRAERLAAQIHEIIAAALATDLKDPRVGFVTVTGVTVSPDGSHATVRVAVMGDDADKARAMKGLASAKGFLRTRVAQSMRLRAVPELHIVLDQGLEHAARIDALLDDIKHDEQDPDRRSSATG